MKVFPSRPPPSRNVPVADLDTLLTRQNRLEVWLMAVRPRTLPLSLLPVIVGSAWAWLIAGEFSVAVALCAALAAALIQIGTNLYNDVKDHTRGVDTALRLGPTRVTHGGLLPAAAVTRAAWLSFAVSLVPGGYLCLVGGWPIVVLGVLSLFFGWLYSGGRLPLSFTPFSEVVAFLFFGVAAVVVTATLHGARVEPGLLATGAIIGAPCTALLLVNNHRDRAADWAAGRRTLAILLGRDGSRLAYGLLLLMPAGLALLPWLHSTLGSSALWLVLSLPAAAALTVRFWREPVGRGLNRFLGLTVLYEGLIALLLIAAMGTAGVTW